MPDQQEQPSLLVAALAEAKKSGVLKFSLPVSEKWIRMIRSTGRHQLIAQKLYDPNKRAYEFVTECIRQTATIIPDPTGAPLPIGSPMVIERQFTMDELIDSCNEDLDVLHEMYARFNHTGKYSVTEKELDSFFESH